MAHVPQLHAVPAQPANHAGRLEAGSLAARQGQRDHLDGARAVAAGTWEVERDVNRWQHILAGVRHEWFANLLAELVSEEQGARVAAALLPIAASTEVRAPDRAVMAGAL